MDASCREPALALYRTLCRHGVWDGPELGSLDALYDDELAALAAGVEAVRAHLAPATGRTGEGEGR